MNSPYQSPSSNVEAGSMTSCVGCGKEIHITASMCPGCGASQRAKRYKSKTTAALLAFFLGGFGAHRFYLGQWWGIFYLLFFWAWIPGLIALIEFIVFLVSDSAKWDDKYNEGKPAGPNERGGAGVVIAIIAGGFFFIMMIGILAAVALPAYQDYTVRAKVAEGIVQVTPIKQEVEMFYGKNRMIPDSNIMLGLKEPHILTGSHQVTVSEFGVELRFSSDTNILDGETILFEPQLVDRKITWVCTGGSLADKHRPAQCRK